MAAMTSGGFAPRAQRPPGSAWRSTVRGRGVTGRSSACRAVVRHEAALVAASLPGRQRQIGTDPLARGEYPMRPLHSMMVTLTVIITAVALGQASGAKAARPGQAEQEVRAMIQQYRQALLRRDVAALKRI